MSGKTHDVLVLVKRGIKLENGDTFDVLQVYAEPGNIEIIRAVPGVANAQVSTGVNSIYNILPDMRYDLDYLAKEIEAAIMCNGVV